MNRSFYLTLFFFACFSMSCSTQTTETDNTDEETPILTEEQKIKNVYETFERTVSQKNVNGHLALFLSPITKVNISLKSNGNPENNLINATTWTRYFSRPETYQVDISETKINVHDNVAFSEARFDLLRNTGYTGFGIDLFMYVKTPQGWKYVVLNNTYQDNTDTTDYDNFNIDSNPIDLLLNMANHFNSKNDVAFKSIFLNPRMPCFMFENEFSDTFDVAKHTAKGFSDNFLSDALNLKISISNNETKIIDHYMAKSTSDVVIMQDDRVYIEGKIHTTYLGDTTNGWKISAMVISIKNKYFDL